MELNNKDKCTYCREYGNLPCDECDKKAKAMEQPKKYIKVAVSERLPELDKRITVIWESGESCSAVVQENDYWYSFEMECECDTPDFWLEEVPDRESELIEMLGRASKTIKSLKLSMLAHPDYTEGSEFDDLTSIARDQENEIDSLIQSVKQPK